MKREKWSRCGGRRAPCAGLPDFAWPALVGSSARLPFLLAFVGVFGGLQVFGLIGLVLGPVIMALVMTIWRDWVVTPASD